MNDPIKAKIQALCPDVMKLKFDLNLPNVKAQIPKDITLAVVLRAINKQGFDNREHHERVLYSLCNGMNAVKDNAKASVGWNLEHDNYDQQSEECKHFIGSLLGVLKSE